VKDIEEIAQVLDIKNPGIGRLLKMIGEMLAKGLFSKNSLFNLCLLLIFYVIFIWGRLPGRVFWFLYRRITRLERK
jgi:hypothetical protein